MIVSTSGSRRTTSQVIPTSEDVLYVATRNEYDLRDAFDVDPPEPTDRGTNAD